MVRTLLKAKNISLLIGQIKTIKYLNAKVIVFAKQFNKIKINASDWLKLKAQ